MPERGWKVKIRDRERTEPPHVPENPIQLEGEDE